jgi:integrase
MPTSPPVPARLPHVKAVRRADRVWLYYRRGGRQWPLPGPEGSAAHILAHERVHRAYDHLRQAPVRTAPGTVDAAITAYLASADYLQHAESTKRDYRRVLDRFREAFGPIPVSALDVGWWEALRAKHIGSPIGWNDLRSRMKEVLRLYRKTHPGEIPANPLDEVRRLKVAKSNQNRPWPLPVLEAVTTAATPEFRALIVGYLLTAQRGGDVTRWTPSQYDRAARTITIEQEKTGASLILHAPATLAEAFEAMRGRRPDRLFVTPRGEAWTLANAQETLARLLRQLRLPRYTLHGLRATGPTALKMLGMENRRIRSLTGHDSDSNLEIYLRGADGYEMAREAQEALEGIFGGVLAKAATKGNATKAAGVTGRAAAKARSKQGAT